MSSAVAAEMAGGLRVVDKAGGGKVRIVGADAVDQRPQRLGIGRGFGPAGQKASRVGKGEADAHVEADQRVGGQVLQQPVQHFAARPAVAGADQFRRGAAAGAERDGDAAVALPGRPGPVDGGEVAEPVRSHPPRFSRRFLFHHSSRFSTSRSNPRSTGR